MPSKQFGTLLKEAVHRIAVCEQKTLAVVQDELGYMVGREGAQAIYHWRRGNIPEAPVVEKLARAIADRSDLGKSWLRGFLVSADYSYVMQLCEELFPSTAQTARLEPESAEPTFLMAKDYRQLIGRDDELKRLIAVISDRNAKSIIGIDGIGGMGKSALAQETAELCRNRQLIQQLIWISSADVLLASGAALTFEIVLDVIARQLGITDSASTEERMAQIKLRLRHQSVLIVLDNLDSAPLTQQTLLTRLQPLLGISKVIATSRQRFTGDIFEVHLKGLTEGAGRHFLLQEGRDRGIDSLLSATRAELEQIVVATGGAPLAMKLLIGQLAFLPLKQIIDRLQQVRLTEAPDADDNEFANFYHTLYLPSWRLLSLPAQHLLIHLAIFPQRSGGDFATLQAVSDWSTAELAKYLRELWRFSLVETQRLADMGLSEQRYYLHALTRYFVTSELFRHTVVDEAWLLPVYNTGKVRYIAHFFSYLATYAKMYKRLDVEVETIAEALRLATQPPPAADLLDYVNRFGPYLLARGRYQQVEQLLQQALAVATSTAQPAALITAWVLQGQVLLKFGLLAEARQQLHHALDYATQQQLVLESADVLQTLAEVEINFGIYAAATAYLQQALVYAQAQKDQRRITRILGLSGRCAAAASDFAQATAFLQQAFQVALSLDEVELTIPILIQQAATAGMQADFMGAERFARQALALAETVDHREWIASSLKQLSGALIVRGCVAEGEECARRGLEIARAIGQLELASGMLNNLAVLVGDTGYLAQDRARIEQALQYYLEGLEIVREQGNRERTRSFLSNVTLVLLHLDRAQQAGSYILEADQIAQILGNEWAIADTKIALGKWQVAQAKWAEAESSFQLALAASQATMPELEADALWGLAKVAAGRANFQKARVLGLESLHLLQQIQSMTDAQALQAWLDELPNIPNL